MIKIKIEKKYVKGVLLFKILELEGLSLLYLPVQYTNKENSIHLKDYHTFFIKIKGCEEKLITIGDICNQQDIKDIKKKIKKACKLLHKTKKALHKEFSLFRNIIVLKF